MSIDVAPIMTKVGRIQQRGDGVRVGGGEGKSRPANLAHTRLGHVLHLVPLSPPPGTCSARLTAAHSEASRHICWIQFDVNGLVV